MLGVYLLAFFIGFVLAVFNVATILLGVTNRKLRGQLWYYIIISFLAASLIQGLIPAPFYTYKILSNQYPIWLCDTYRMMYFYCGHTIKWTLLLLSFERLLAVKYPYKYEKYVTKRNILFSIIFIWLITIAIDIFPFVSEENGYCLYNPSKIWGLCVIFIYNIIPFCLISINYLLIWKVAAKFEYYDRKREYILSKQNQDEDFCDRTGNKIKKRFCFIKLATEIKATKTSLILLSVYIVCWGPLGITYMIDHFCNSCISGNKSFDILTAFVKYLCFSSSLLAPVAYCWLNKMYQQQAIRFAKKLVHFRVKSASKNQNEMETSLHIMRKRRKERVTEDMQSNQSSGMKWNILEFM